MFCEDGIPQAGVKAQEEMKGLLFFLQHVKGLEVSLSVPQTIQELLAILVTLLKELYTLEYAPTVF